MPNFKLFLTGTAVASLLAACGGGGEGPSLSGLAATGAAMANASVTAKCATGLSIAGTTGSDGTFNLKLGDSQAPCLIQVTKGAITLHSFASASGRINVTPLTDMVVARALGGRPADAFGTFNAATGSTIQSGLAAAKTYARNQVIALAGSAPSGDLLTGTFKVGDADDVILDSLKVALTAAGKSYDDLRVGAATGGALGATLDRGKLIGSATTVATLPASYINGVTSGNGLQALTGAATCDVKVVKLNYKTIGVAGEATNASGVMLVPTGSCTTAAGLIAYAKGTDVQKPRTLANPADGETFLLLAMYAAKGYAVVATDYLGFADSTYAYHPYLHADTEASSVIDSIRAARNAASSVGATLSGKVMLTGYSQGGHASMAAHRAIERDNSAEINVIAGAHLAGPYNMSGSFKLPNAIAGYQFFVTYLVTAWQKVYGNIYTDVNLAFKPAYATGIESLLPSPTLDYTTLITNGKLPFAALPNDARDALFQSAFITDSQTNNSSPLYLAGKKNDLLGWNPKSKVLLCGGAGDPTVPPAVHQTVMKADFDSRNLTNVTSVDVDAYVQGTYGTVKTSDPATYYGNYHGTYEPPFCHAQAKAAFDAASAL
jgi:pimeloyl-ACP methyl ester carboxylesterase